MGFFSRSAAEVFPWEALTSEAQLQDVLNNDEEVVFIFKHSTRCSVSRMALKQFENEFNSHDSVETYFLDLIAYRDVSNEIATRFQVVHQSPQLVLIKEGKSVYNASHSDIDAQELKSKI
mgnify:CR=1 FL=1